MPKKKRFKKIYIVQITGNAKALVDQTINEFFSTTVKTFYKLRFYDEELVVQIGSIFCSCLEGQPHSCIAKIKMELVDMID